jgi:hypothetical protein
MTYDRVFDGAQTGHLAPLFPVLYLGANKATSARVDGHFLQLRTACGCVAQGARRLRGLCDRLAVTAPFALSVVVFLRTHLLGEDLSRRTAGRLLCSIPGILARLVGLHRHPPPGLIGTKARRAGFNFSQRLLRYHSNNTHD